MKIPAINGAFCFLAYFVVGRADIPPVGARSAGNGRGQGRALSQSPAWQTGSRNNPVVMNVSQSIPDCTDSWLDTSSNCWPLDEHYYTEVFLLYARLFKPMALPCGAAFLHRPPALLLSNKTGTTA